MTGYTTSKWRAIEALKIEVSSKRKKAITIGFALIVYLEVLNILYRPEFYEAWQEFNVYHLNTALVVLVSYLVSFCAIGIVINIFLVYLRIVI